MTSIIYSDAPYTGPAINLARINATKKALSHYSNALFLTAVQQKPRDLNEKRQATKELTICERKITYWRRMSNFDKTLYENEALKMRNAWHRS